MAVKKKEPLKKKEERGKNKPVVNLARLKNGGTSKGPRKISKRQKFQLEIIARTNFNLCNGKLVAKLLRENRRMWRAALLPLNLISLRDLDEDFWHADTLYIYAEEGFEHALEELVNEQFKADEVYWIGGSGAVDIMGASGEGFEEKSQVVLSAWWD